MSHQRPLLIPWLREQIDSGRYPGVEWTDPERRHFSVPWKHALRQDSSDTDILIFKAWAEVSGNGRAQGEPSVWKRNFRSALRAKGFTTVDDHKNETANPHKVYRWPDEAGASSKSASKSQVSDEGGVFEGCGLPTQETQELFCFDDLYLPEEAIFADSTINQDILQQCLSALHIIDPKSGGITGFEPVPEQQQRQEQVVIGGYPLPGQQQYPVTLQGAGSESGLPEQPAHPAEGAVGGACGAAAATAAAAAAAAGGDGDGDGNVAELFRNTMIQTNDGDHFKTEFRVSVYFRGHRVMEHLVKNEAGVRLVYSPNHTGTILDNETGLTSLFLPGPVAMSDQKQAKLTQGILDLLGDGVEVGVSRYLVFGRRRGEVKAFWSLSKHERSRQPQELSKLEPQPLYLFGDFLRGISGFIGGSPECPPCSLFFCLGEKWPDPDNRPWEKKLITVEVVLTSMELLKDMAVEGGASSLRSMELQLSLEEMMELC